MNKNCLTWFLDAESVVTVKEGEESYDFWEAFGMKESSNVRSFYDSLLSKDVEYYPSR